MHHVRLEVVEQALVVGDNDGRSLGSLQLVHTLGHDAQSVDIEARVCFVKDAEAWLEHSHLEYLILLLLTATEALVHRAIGELAVEFHEGALLAHELEELVGCQGREVAVFALLVDGGTHEVYHAHTGNLHGVLEREEHALVAAVLGSQLKEVLSIECYLTFGHLIRGMPHEHIAQRTLTRAVGTHDSVHLTRAYLEVNTLQYLFAIDAGMQVLYV